VSETSHGDENRRHGEKGGNVPCIFDTESHAGKEHSQQDCRVIEEAAVDSIPGFQG
jgi:hypothetical protein